MDDLTKLRQMLERASVEIQQNRATIERLAAKCEVLDMLSAMLNLHRISGAMSPDLLWEIRKTLEATAPKVAP